MDAFRRFFYADNSAFELVDFERVDRFDQRARRRAPSRPSKSTSRGAGVEELGDLSGVGSRMTSLTPQDAASFQSHANRHERRTQWSRQASLVKPKEIENAATSWARRFRLTPELQLLLVVVGLLVAFLLKKMLLG